jgi:hypothetical protein
MTRIRARVTSVLFAFVCLAGATAQTALQAPSNLAPVSRYQYFPAGVFGSSSQLGDATATWYAQTLTALTEPSLFELRADKTVQIYRFLWLPSFHRPISVRLTINSDGSGAVVAKSVDKHTGLITTNRHVLHDSGNLILDTVGDASKTQVQDVLKQLQGLEFWTMKTEDDGGGYEDAQGYHFKSVGMDGARWVLEGVNHGDYHVVDRWSPGTGSYAELCKYLLQVAKAEVDGKVIY